MLPDHLRPDLKILFCGTAAGNNSATAGRYYANSGNKFWAMLAETGITPGLLSPDQDHLMPTLGFGLTDLAKGVSGMDRHIPKTAIVPARLAEIIETWRPRCVAFTGLGAAKKALLSRRVVEGRLPSDPRWPELVLWALQSTSGANNRHFTRTSWQSLADWAREQP